MSLRHLVLPLLLLVTSALPAQEKKAQAVALVKEAVAFSKQFGRLALLRETNVNSGRFHVKAGNDLYLFIFDTRGFALAHGAQANMVNINRMESKDPDGKYFVREFIQAVAAGGAAWVDYKYSNPKSGKIEAKTSYLELAEGGLIIGCGIYK